MECHPLGPLTEPHAGTVLSYVANLYSIVSLSVTSHLEFNRHDHDMLPVYLPVPT